MSQDTNREDCVERAPTATGIVWNCHRAYFKVCLACGAVADSDAEDQIPCGH